MLPKAKFTLYSRIDKVYKILSRAKIYLRKVTSKQVIVEAR